MADINSVVLTGNLVKDSVLDYVSTGSACMKFVLANNMYVKNDPDGHVNFFECVMWGKGAEALSKYLVKGKGVTVHGELKQQRWSDDDGKTKSRIEIRVQSIKMAGKREKKEEDEKW